jgi:hypothetical protein
MAKRPKILWQVNDNTNELHRVEAGAKHPGKCHLDQVSEGDLTTYPTAKAAFNDPRRKVKVDAAKHCNRRFKSRENT